MAYSSSAGIVHAVRDVSLEIREKETLALAGETGSGKTTLGLALSGLLDSQARVVSGEILFEGRSHRSLSNRDWQQIRGPKIGIIFQDARSALNPILTIKDHLIETILAHQRISRKEAQLRASGFLQEAGIPKSHEKRYAFELSGGMCQRAGIALAICNNPRLLIADEPTSSLDSTIQAQILDLLLLMKQRHGLALLLVSHDLALLSQVADRAAIMYGGRIVESGLTGEVFASPGHPYTQVLIQCLAGLHHHHEMDPLKSIPGLVPAPDHELPGCAFAPRCAKTGPGCDDSVPMSRKLSDTHWVECIRGYGIEE